MVLEFVFNLLLVISLLVSQLPLLLIKLFKCFLLNCKLLKVMLKFVVGWVLLTQPKLPYMPLLWKKLKKEMLFILIFQLFTLELVLVCNKFLFHHKLIVLLEEVQIQ